MNDKALYIVALIPMYGWFAWRFVSAWKSYETAKRGEEDMQGWSNMASSGLMYFAIAVFILTTIGRNDTFLFVFGLVMALLGLWQCFWWIKTRMIKKGPNKILEDTGTSAPDPQD